MNQPNDIQDLVKLAGMQANNNRPPANQTNAGSLSLDSVIEEGWFSKFKQLFTPKPASAPTAQPAYTGIDPIVRQRLGMQPATAGEIAAYTKQNPPAVKTTDGYLTTNTGTSLDPKKDFEPQGVVSGGQMDVLDAALKAANIQDKPIPLANLDTVKEVQNPLDIVPFEPGAGASATIPGISPALTSFGTVGAKRAQALKSTPDTSTTISATPTPSSTVDNSPAAIAARRAAAQRQASKNIDAEFKKQKNITEPVVATTPQPSVWRSARDRSELPPPGSTVPTLTDRVPDPTVPNVWRSARDRSAMLPPDKPLKESSVDFEQIVRAHEHAGGKVTGRSNDYTVTLADGTRRRYITRNGRRHVEKLPPVDSIENKSENLKTQNIKQDGKKKINEMTDVEFRGFVQYYQLLEEKMSKTQRKKKEEIVVAMKKTPKQRAELKRRYGERWEEVAHATATKRAMQLVKEQNSMRSGTGPQGETVRILNPTDDAEFRQTIKGLPTRKPEDVKKPPAPSQDPVSRLLRGEKISDIFTSPEERAAKERRLASYQADREGRLPTMPPMGSSLPSRSASGVVTQLPTSSDRIAAMNRYIDPVQPSTARSIPAVTPPAAASDVTPRVLTTTAAKTVASTPVIPPSSEGRVGRALAQYGITRDQRRDQAYVDRMLGSGYQAGSAEANLALLAKAKSQPTSR